MYGVVALLLTRMVNATFLFDVFPHSHIIRHQ